ncbi:MAG TPA: hypothetical protein PLW02_02435 [Verrucomicrobiota bacterium]|nr:hypothetical protein [Verrucomicrobiota bacterium]
MFAGFNLRANNLEYGLLCVKGLDEFFLECSIDILVCVLKQTQMTQIQRIYRIGARSKNVLADWRRW